MIRLVTLVFIVVAGSAATAAWAAEGCGAGFHLNNHGHCVVNRPAAVVTAPAVVVAPPAVVVAPGAVVVKPCPVGYHMGSNGHCRPN